MAGRRGTKAKDSDADGDSEARRKWDTMQAQLAAAAATMDVMPSVDATVSDRSAVSAPTSLGGGYLDAVSAPPLGAMSPASGRAKQMPRNPAGPPELALEAHAFRDRVRRELLAMTPDAAADERLLLELAADSTGTAHELARLSERLVAACGHVVDKPSVLRAVAGAARDLTVVQNAIVGRTQRVLMTAASLRAQRRFSERHERRGRNA